MAAEARHRLEGLMGERPDARRHKRGERSERVLAGLLGFLPFRRRTVTEPWDEQPDDDVGGAPVREPLRPRPAAPGGAVALTLPEDTG